MDPSKFDLSPLTKKAWKAYDPELREMAQAMLISDRLNSEDIYSRLEEIAGTLDDDGSQRVKNLFAGYVSDGLSAATTSKNGVDQKALMKKLLTANTLLGGLKVGAGLAQIIDGAAKKKKLSPPKFPEGYQKNDLLASQITKAIYQSEQGDPKMQEFYKSKVAEANDLDNFRAKVSGNIGQYAANIQGNAIKKNKALGEFAVKNEAIKRQGRSRLDNLIGQDVSEDKFIAQQQRQDYRTKQGEYERAINDIQRQKNSGFSNMFKGLDDIGSASPYLSSIPGEEKSSDQSSSLGVSDNSSFPEVTDDQVFQNYDIGLLGNDHYRQNQKLVDMFRRTTGNRNEGPWTDDDEQIRRKLLLDPLPEYMR